MSRRAAAGFIIPDQILRSPEGRKYRLGIYGYDPQSKQCSSNASFGTGRRPYISHPEIAGNVWRHNGGFKTGHVKASTTNTFVGIDAVVFETQYTEDDTHCVTMLTGKDIRIR